MELYIGIIIGAFLGVLFVIIATPRIRRKRAKDLLLKKRKEINENRTFNSSNENNVQTNSKEKE